MSRHAAGLMLIMFALNTCNFTWHGSSTQDLLVAHFVELRQLAPLWSRDQLTIATGLYMRILMIDKKIAVNSNFDV